jgi:hypothetical protein
LNIEEQQLRLKRLNRRQRGRAVAELADHAQIALGLAVLAQGATAGQLVVDDDDIHHASTSASARRSSRTGE